MFEIPKARRGGNVRNGRCTFPNVRARKERADARKVAYDALTPEQKLARLDACNLVAKKQRAKLYTSSPARGPAKRDKKGN